MPASSESASKELYVEKFKGNNFSSWKLRLKSKMGLLNEEYGVLFGYFEQSKFNYQITDNDFKKSDGSIDADKIKLSKSLKAYILCHCDYTMDTVLQAESTEHGFELWRRLRDRYDQVTHLSFMRRLTNTCSMKFEEDSLENNLSTWESEISKYLPPKAIYQIPF